ncbi:MAG: Flp pilus assembly complex ATPase component TadA [Candidatus Eisenbacteria bacterium]|uniref:Flp pilus assembly complex ATPase component TadA n=1 Tax=Eiseniibacteriota bacterium TaxID=2212470 RepID=A0A948W5R1_UNCEI|nr:Flp pilus assembly complex ATPase component TadA [Candidatus Eisenbacteria bacterium]MBU1950243.1 Flp pilus assembly complex ATPase component TadA [Candidatus Eisenbacteria bacterium]MBU2690699.1 Flp pilus assembly complex ATPase component TadA [Candidatus Eisenbacteria bacterium]
MSDTMPRGEELVAQGYLTRNQLETALNRSREAPHLSLEEISLQQGFISEGTFKEIISEPPGNLRPRLGTLLVQQELVTEGQLAKALAIQSRTGGLLGQILIRLGHLNEDQLVETLASQFALPFVPIGHLRPNRSLRRVLNSTYALRNGVVPIGLIGRRLTVALSDPTYRKPVEELASLTGYDIDIVLSTHAQVEQLRAYLYGDDEPDVASTGTESHSTTIPVTNSPVAKRAPKSQMSTDALLMAVFEKGVQENATTVHLDPSPRGPRLYFRVEGELQDYSAGELGTQIALSYRAIVHRLKTLAKLDLTERRRPQVGQIKLEQGKRDEARTVEFYLNVMPTREGEAITIRITECNEVRKSLDDLQFCSDVLPRLYDIVQAPHGIFLCTGPSSSGKSTTLWAAADFLNAKGRKVVAISTRPGPVISNILRVPMPQEGSPDFPILLEHVDKLDPDVILIDEIQSSDTAEWVVEWARSGRKVLASLRSMGSRAAMGTFNRLAGDELGLGEHLSGLVGQRLLRAVCPDCSKEYSPDQKIIARLGDLLPAEAQWRSGEGCAQCGFTGIRGRIPVVEMWIPGPTRNVTPWFQESQDEAGSGGWSYTLGGAPRPIIEAITQVVDAIGAAARGKITLEEVVRSFDFWELGATSTLMPSGRAALQSGEPGGRAAA